MIDLRNCDCYDLLKSIQDNSVDLVLTDPPYNTTNLDFEYDIDVQKLFKEFWRVLKENGCVLMFSQQPFTSKVVVSNPIEYKYSYYWQKERPTNIFQLKRRPGKVIEEILVFYKKQPNYFPIKYTVDHRVKNSPKGNHVKVIAGSTSYKVTPYKDDGTRYPNQVLNFKRDNLSKNIHPTQKPLELLEYLIKTFTIENETVLDCFSGSGSTALATFKQNRKFIGCELNNEYYALSVKRLLENNVKI